MRKPGKVVIMLLGSRSQPGVLIDVGPGLYGLPRITLPRTPVNKAFSDAELFGRCHHAGRGRWLARHQRGRKEASSYVGAREQGDRADRDRSSKLPRPESMVSASSRGLQSRTSRCVGPPEQDQECRLLPALRDGL